MRPHKFTLSMAGAFLSLTGCAMSGQVQRQTVEYNSTIYGMENQLALLNIARAKEGLPTLYTSIGRLTGTITVKTAAGFGAQIKAPQPTTLNSTTTGNSTGSGTSLSNMVGSGTSNSATGAATTNGTSGSLSSTTGSSASLGSTLTSLAQTAIARGGNVYSPTISGEIDSGPSFDIQILDTQQFYRGMLAGLDQTTFLNFIDQGANGDVLLHLLVYKIYFKATAKTDVVFNPTNTLHVENGQVARTWTNAPLGEEKRHNNDRAKDFWPVAACYVVSSAQLKGEDTPLARVDRVVVSKDGKEEGLRLSDLSALDGTQLGLKSIRKIADRSGKLKDAETPKKDVFVGSPEAHDADLLIVKPGQAKEVAALSLRPSPLTHPYRCHLPNDPDQELDDNGKALPGNARDSVFWDNVAFVPATVADDVVARRKKAKLPVTGISEPASAQDRLWYFANGSFLGEIPVKAEMIPRSTESVIQYLGAYSRYAPFRKDQFLLDDRLMFSMPEGKNCHEEVVGVNLGKQHYCIAGGEDKVSNMQILSLVEQLINLNKAGTDRPTTIPVQVVP